jgi:hypothetical protein
MCGACNLPYGRAEIASNRIDHLTNRRNFHEQLDRPEALPLPSDRSTGFVFAVVALVVAYFQRDDRAALTIALSVAAAFAAVALIMPILLRPLNIVWMKFALLLSKIVNPIVMLVLYLVVIVPAGLLMQLVRDPLQRRRDKAKQSYWIDRSGEATSSMTNQF